MKQTNPDYKQANPDLRTFEWTPKGRKLEFTDSMEYQKLVIGKLRLLVRETSYNLLSLETENAPKDEAFSRAVYLRQEAVDALRLFDSEAESFIESTYKPEAFLHA